MKNIKIIMVVATVALTFTACTKGEDVQPKKVTPVTNKLDSLKIYI